MDEGMDMEQWISVGIMARERWAGSNGETVIRRCTGYRVVVPIHPPLAFFLDIPVGRCERNGPLPFKQETVVLEKLRLGSGEEIHIGYGERTNSLWINEG